METKGIRRVILAAIAILICFSFSDFYFGGNYQTGLLNEYFPYTNHQKLSGTRHTSAYKVSKLTLSEDLPKYELEIMHVSNDTLQQKLQEVSNNKAEEKYSWKNYIKTFVDGHGNVYPEQSASEKTRTIGRSREYCNPPSMEMGEEGKVDKILYKLKQVHVIIRHGDRSPMAHLPGDIQAIRTSCLTEPSEFPEDIGSHISRFVKDTKNCSKHRAYAFKLYPDKTFCYGAELTGIGAAQHLVSGVKLRSTYIKRHGLLPPDWNSSHVHILTTQYSRTYQSAISFLYGFLDTCDPSKRTLETAGFPLFCTKNMVKFTGAPCHCEGTKLITKLGKAQAHKSTKNSSLLREFRSDIVKLANISENQVPWAGSLLDALSSYECHNKSLPCYTNTGNCFTEELIAKLWRVRDELFTQREARNPYFQASDRLTIHPLLSNILKRMEHSTKGSNLKFVLYSGHDMTITPIVVALGFGIKTHPSYAARIVFELYESTKEVNRNYLRILYNGKDITKTVVFCRGKTNSDGVCPVEALKAYVDQTKTFYSSMCKISESDMASLPSRRTYT